MHFVAWYSLLAMGAADAPPEFDVKLDVVLKGYDGKTCWVHPRAGIIPGKTPSVVMTLQRAILTGSDVFTPLSDLRTDDLGMTWSAPREFAKELSRLQEPDDVEVGACDFFPQWHAASGKLLAIGHSVRYRKNQVIPDRRRETTYSVYDAEGRTWSPWTTLEMPDEPRFYNSGAGCVQRVDLPDGTILLPTYFKKQGDERYRVATMKCTFDGRTLRVGAIGDAISVDDGRGVYEPSLVLHRGRFLLTLRNDNAGYVCSSPDGMNFTTLQKWRFSDGQELGNYNTQQHWVQHPRGLFLVYTRRGANNDHVFRHRAPLFIAAVDPEWLHVERSTERILVPERGARLGNFGVTVVSPEETWVTVAEWMQGKPPMRVIPVDNERGADNSVYVARIRWKPGQKAVSP